MHDAHAMPDHFRNKSGNASLANKLYYSIIFLASLFFFAFCIYSHDQNWDILGYSASAISLANDDPNFIHSYVFSELNNYGTQSARQKLTTGTDYAVTMHQDADAFYQQIPYYKIRIIFVGLIYILTKVGMNIFSAGHLVAASAGAIGLILFFYSFKSYIKPSLWPMIPFFFILCGALDSGQYVTADTLAYFWIGAISLAFIKKHWAVLPLIALSVLVRTDLAVLVAIMLAYIFVYWPGMRLKTCITAIVAAALYLGINKLAGNYGWSTVFYYVFVSDMTATHPAEFSQYSISFQQYIDQFVSNLVWIFYESEFWLYIAFMVLQLLLFNYSQSEELSRPEKLKKYLSDPIISLALISSAYIFIHYLLFPAMWTRFFLGQYMIVAVGLLYTITLLLYKLQSGKITESS